MRGSDRMLPGGFSPRSVVCDTGIFCLLAIVSLATGFLINLLRVSPLSLIYVSKEQHLEQAVRLVLPPSQTASASAQAAQVRMIDLDEFQKLVSRSGAIVLDARSATFYRLGHVPGALNLSREAFERDYAALRLTLESKKDQAVAVYCSGADCQDSRLVAEALLKLGFGTVLVYPEGWEQWAAAGLPQEPPAKGDS